MNLVAWMLFGLIVGVVANTIDPRPSQGGLVGSIILGILGSVVGGFVGDLIFGVGVTGFNLSSFIIAIAGSLLVLYIARAFRRA